MRSLDGQITEKMQPACPQTQPAADAHRARGLLLFQEQIQGPENASIARFDGLGCY